MRLVEASIEGALMDPLLSANLVWALAALTVVGSTQLPLRRRAEWSREPRSAPALDGAARLASALE